MIYFERKIEPLLREYLTAFSVVGLTGPRQSGKSTLLLESLGKEYRYVSFDDQQNIDMFYSDPKWFMNKFDNKVIFDEAQKVPELFDAIKLEVDKDRDNYGKYIVTGSSQFSLVDEITESLAGRIGLLTLLPLQINEMPNEYRGDAVFRGSYPELVRKGYVQSDAWYASYMTTYLERDVRSLANIGDIRDFTRLIKMLAANCSQQLNLSRYAADLGVAVSTIKRWVSVLEASYIIFLLPPYFKNYGKRIVKSPKVYFYDTGLVAHLTRITSRDLFENGPMLGSLFENYVLCELLKKEIHQNRHSELCYYRTNHGAEVDLIIDRVQSKELYEIKYTSSYKLKMIKHMEPLLEEGDKGYLLYNGQPIDCKEQIQAFPYQNYLVA